MGELESELAASEGAAERKLSSAEENIRELRYAYDELQKSSASLRCTLVDRFSVAKARHEEDILHLHERLREAAAEKQEALVLLAQASGTEDASLASQLKEDPSITITALNELVATREGALSRLKMAWEKNIGEWKEERHEIVLKLQQQENSFNVKMAALVAAAEMEQSQQRAELLREKENSQMELLREKENSQIELLREKENCRIEILREKEAGRVKNLQIKEQHVSELLRQQEQSRACIAQEKDARGEELRQERARWLTKSQLEQELIKTKTGQERAHEEEEVAREKDQMKAEHEEGLARAMGQIGALQAELDREIVNHEFAVAQIQKMVRYYRSTMTSTISSTNDGLL